MTVDIQKASFWKRISAFMLDAIVMVILAVGCGAALSGALRFSEYNEKVQAAYTQYEEDYGISFELTQEEYETMLPEERDRFDEAYDALIADQEAMYAYNMTIYLSMLITTMGILIAVILLEFVGPMMLGNGQTLGKKVFGLGVMRVDSVRLTTIQLFIRTFLGKFTIEIMIPILLVLALFFNIIGPVGLIVLGGIVLLQVILLGVSKTNSAIHDHMAGTVVIDIASQRIFETTDDMIEYKKKIAAEKAARQAY
ncbi:MAG: RDD family protein [Lachnospiraceae bacterium]|nr:RDD family protein [Lachnospiraceae bacterium]